MLKKKQIVINYSSDLPYKMKTRNYYKKQFHEFTNIHIYGKPPLVIKNGNISPNIDYFVINRQSNNISFMQLFNWCHTFCCVLTIETTPACLRLRIGILYNSVEEGSCIRDW